MPSPPEPQALDDTSPSSHAALAPGTMILDDRFRIEKLLGGGGMGIVYLAEQVSLGRKVAVKVLREDLPFANGMSERFRREALLLSSVDHPAVVRIIDFGQTGSSACIVMELVEGEPLDAILQREAPLSVERAERLLIHLAQGLSAIHAKGIVHRDLKPENVVVTRSPEGVEQARLLDFGIARLAAPDSEANVTQVGFVMGTPEYLSPEQALAQPLDARSDLYALGVIGFKMLSGQHPFPGPSAQQFMAQHIHQAAPQLLEVAPHLAEFAPLTGALMRCLEKSPDARPQTAQAFVDALQAPPLQLTRTLTSALRTAAPTRAGEPPARSRAWLWKGALAGLLAGALALGAFFFLDEPQRKARRLVAAGRGPEALQAIDDSGAQAQSWPMKQVRASALHQVGRHEEEWELVKALPEEEPLEPQALTGIADDFGHGEGLRLRKLLQDLPKAKALPVLQALAKGEQSWAQWGALRFVDFAYAGQGLPLGGLYSRALESRDCRTRAIAAKRLSELRTAEAVEPLRRLKALPRTRSAAGDDECGQDAAAAALLKLERELNP